MKIQHLKMKNKKKIQIYENTKTMIVVSFFNVVMRKKEVSLMC